MAKSPLALIAKKNQSLKFLQYPQRMGQADQDGVMIQKKNYYLVRGAERKLGVPVACDGGRREAPLSTYQKFSDIL